MKKVTRTYSNVIGFDDAPFNRDSEDRVLIVGAVFAALRLEGFLSGYIEKDGYDSTDFIITLISGSNFKEHLQLILLQGITFAGFNIVDIHRLNETLNLPVIVVCRKEPDFESIREALMNSFVDGEKRWRLIQQAGNPEKYGNVFIQRAGLPPADAEKIVNYFCIHSLIPEPLRVAHLAAGALQTGHSRGRP